MNKPIPGTESMRRYNAHRQPPETRGDYFFEDGRAAYFFDNIIRLHGPVSKEKQLEYMIYAAAKYGCRITGPGIEDEMPVL